ncbi:MAG TPA: nuclear transport factor 2 family protein [Gemmatimonadales bacterium]|nr:nuclear transport factor 2 family protein [Gemmatimonadales bacterium]
MRAMLASVLGLAAMACGSAGGPQAILDTDRSAMRAALDSFSLYVVQHRDSTAAAMFTDNATVLPPNQSIVQGRAAIRTWIKQSPPLSHFIISAVDINGRGDLAYVRGTYQSVQETGPTDHGKFVEIRRREQNGRWLITTTIFNSDLPAVPPVRR